MAYRVAATLLSVLLALAVGPSQAARHLRQYPGYPSNMYSGMAPSGLLSTLQEKKDAAMYAIDTAKQFAEGLKAGKGKGKGAPMQQAVAPTYVVTSQPQIMVAPMPQLLPPTMVASAPQVQAPPPSPEIKYVPVPVKETIVKPVIVPIPIPKIKPIHPKEFFKSIAKAVILDFASQSDQQEGDVEAPTTNPSAPPANNPSVPPPAEPVAPAVAVPSAPADQVFTPTPDVITATPTTSGDLTVTTPPQTATATAPAAAVQSAPTAGAMPPVAGGTIIAAARTSQPAQQPAVAPVSGPMTALPTFQPMQVLKVQNQVNRQGEVVGQMYGVAAAGR